jgi:PAS domain S-box-containing protein
VALRTGQRVFYDLDVSTASYPDGVLQKYAETGHRAVQSIPLITRTGRPIGVFSTHWRTHHQPSERERRFLDLLARQAADLIERQQTESALRESRARLEAALDAARMTAWEWYPEVDQTIASPSATDVFGLEAGMSLDSSADYFRLIHPQDRERYISLVRQAVDGGKSWHTEFRIIRPRDGQVAWLEERANVSRDPETDRMRTTGLIWDITLQKQIEGQEREQRVLAEALRDTAAELSSTLKLDELLTQTLVLARRFASCDAAYIVLIDSAGAFGHLETDRLNDQERQKLELWHRQYPSYADISLYQATAQTALVQRHADEPDGLSLPIKELLVVPLIGQQEVIAFLVLINRQHTGFDQADLAALQAFAYQLTTAISNAKLFVQAQDLAALQERQQFARDLHDAVSQTLFAASLLIEALPMRWNHGSDEVPQLLSDVNRLIKGAQAEMRTLLLELRPVNLQSTPLRRLFGQLIDTTQGRTRIDVSLTFEGEPVLPWQVHVAVYRIAQETLNNIVKHAQATHAWVAVSGGDNDIELHIRDNGAGFAPGNARAGLGLQMMRERAELIGASLQVDSEPGKGTEIHLRWTAANPPNGIG